MPSLALATLITPKFTFEALAESEAQALGLLESAWSQHFDEHGQPDDMLSFDAVMEEVERPDSRWTLTVRALEVGVAYRDGVKTAAAAAV